MTLREQTEARERAMLAPYAKLSCESAGRGKPIEACPVRTCFQRDIDRIVHCKSFRRLKHKTQVFLRPEGDHYRTRMTHTLEVTRIARAMARGLRLNEDLTEAIALGHDLGHTPFGHAGERILDKIVPGGFKHYEQSLRVAERLENGGIGLNLCAEVCDGIVTHTHGGAATWEGQLIPLADRIAYINHDIDDAIRGGVIRQSDLPGELLEGIGHTHGERIHVLTLDVIEATLVNGQVSQSERAGALMRRLHDFMYEAVYFNPVAKGEEGKAQDMLCRLYEYYVRYPDKLPPDLWDMREQDGTERAVCDYIAGMTDKFAVEIYSNLFIPAAWAVK